MRLTIIDKLAIGLVILVMLIGLTCMGMNVYHQVTAEDCHGGLIINHHVAKK